MNIPDDAIESVTTACPYLTPKGARVAIEAAMPAIREALAQEIELQVAVIWQDEGRGAAWCSGMDDAARVVRGDTR